MRALMMPVVLGACVAAAGCGGNNPEGSTVSVRGALSHSPQDTGHFRAVAITADHKAYATGFDSNGAFSLNIPQGQSFRLVIARWLETSHKRVAGDLVSATARGTGGLIVARGTTVNLGALVVSRNGVSLPFGSTIKALSTDGDHDEHPDQHGTVEEDFDDLCGEHVTLKDDNNGVEANSNNDNELPNCPDDCTDEEIAQGEKRCHQNDDGSNSDGSL